MTLAEQAESFWHAAFDSRRSPDGEFDREITMVVAHSLLVTTLSPIEGFSVQDLLLRLREWYGSRMERLSILWLMSHYNCRDELIIPVAQAISANHQITCDDSKECSLHSLGRLWAMQWIKPARVNANWFVPAILQLVREHPLRMWSMFLPARCADAIESGGMTHPDVASLLTSAADSGLLERLANPESLNITWATITKDAPEETWGAFAEFGNRAVAHGATNLVAAQLDFLVRTGRI
ncbi:hypothetical protein OKHIF_14090 [Mycobacteroides chelonae]